MFSLILAATCAAALAAALLAYMRTEAKNPVLETAPLPGADPEAALRVVQISDVHISVGAVPQKTALRLVLEAAPHVVALTGDYIESAKDVPRFLEWIDGLIGALGGTPVLLTFGNHDEKAFRRSPALKRELKNKLRRRGVLVMEDRTLTFEHRGGVYAFTGYADYYSERKPNIRKAHIGLPKNVRFHIGFSHNPDLALDFKGERPNLFICGHFHGGQIRLPFHLEYTALRRERMSKLGLRRGMMQCNGRAVYISRGLGCVASPLRLGARPEITLFYVP